MVRMLKFIAFGAGFMLLASCVTYPYQTGFASCDAYAGQCYRECEDYADGPDYGRCHADCEYDADQCFADAYGPYAGSGYGYSSRSPWYGRYGSWYPETGFFFSYRSGYGYGYPSRGRRHRDRDHDHHGKDHDDDDHGGGGHPGGGHPGGSGTPPGGGGPAYTPRYPGREAKEPPYLGGQGQERGRRVIPRTPAPQSGYSGPPPGSSGSPSGSSSSTTAPRVAPPPPPQAAPPAPRSSDEGKPVARNPRNDGANKQPD